jgi:drug/metabolite transporter (DMT)-like permease
VLLWGFNFVALKVLYKEMSPPTVSIVRFAAMYLPMLGWCLLRKESLRIPKEHRVAVWLGGFLALGLYMVFFLEGMRTTSAAEGAIVLATVPILTYLLSCLLRQEPFLPMALVGALISFAGVSVVVLGANASSHGSLIGNLTVLAAAVIWSVATLVMRRSLEDIPPVPLMTMGMPAALLALLPYGWSDFVRTDFTMISPLGWLMFAHVALLSGVVAFSLFFYGVKQVGPAGATGYQFLTPVIAAGFGWLVLGQALTAMQGAGALVVLVGLGITTRARFRALA